MKSKSLILLALPLLLLTACKTTVITEEEKNLPIIDNKSEEETIKTPIDKAADISQSYISFTGSKGSIMSHEGKFEEFEASLKGKDISKAVFKANLKISSMVTDNDGLTKHLQSADFFNAEKFPNATFTSTKIVNVEGNIYEMAGKLKIKNIEKKVNVPMVLTEQYLTADFPLNRLDYGIGPDDKGLDAIDSLVPLQMKIVFAN